MGERENKSHDSGGAAEEMTPLEDLLSRALDNMLVSIEEGLVARIEKAEGRAPTVKELIQFATAQWIRHPTGHTVCIFSWRGQPVIQFDYRLNVVTRIPGENTT